ncbi:3'-exoribonuclease [Comamonas phosphati]|nr:3'-exoribonuclease [Comamonas phosphati]
MPRIKPPSKEESALLPAYAGLPDSAIHVPQNDAEFARARQRLLTAPILGFDTESKPIFHSSQPDTGPHVVQLATESEAWLLQLHHPEAMDLAREVLADVHICKPGFGLDNDKQALPRKLGVGLRNILDLDRIFKHHGYGSSVGVRAAVALVLGQYFRKSKKTSTSNWAVRQLSESQRRYAANDAHAAARIHAALADWESRQPPVPAKARRARASAGIST